MARLAGLSRSAAQELVREGKVRVNGAAAAKPGMMIRETDRVDYSFEQPRYVSRGGRKLEAALAAFRIDLRGCVCLDVGASTGGFTDCMLQHGARYVYALDVGTAQLHEKLRADVRVKSLENTNVLAVTREIFHERPSFAAMDVSFVSAAKILSGAQVLAGIGRVVVLVKPQFECGRAKLGKRGIVRDSAAHRAAVEGVTKAGESAGLRRRGVIESPIRGGDGNREYLVFFEQAEEEQA